MNIKLSWLSFLLLGLTALVSCQKTSKSQSEAEKKSSYKSGEAPSGIGSNADMSVSGKEPDISRGSCRVHSNVLDVTEEGIMITVMEVRGYGPNYAFGFPLEGDTLKVVGTDTKGWTAGQSVTVEVQPVFEGYRDESIKVVKYVKTVE